MRAAVIEEFGSAPQYRQVPELEATGSHVVAAAIKNIERMLAAGSHYISRQLSLPMPLGMDAVVALDDGRRLYTGAAPPGGTMAERMLVDPAQSVEVPDGVEDADAAALPNAGVSAWFALEYSGRVSPGQSVLILGGTGVVGGLLIQLAKQRFGTGRVVAVGRDADRLRALERLGADETISIADGSDHLADAVVKAHAEHPFDVVLDCVWGEPAEQTLRALGNDDLSAAYHRTRFVQIGETAGATIDLPAAVLRSAGVELLGQGGGSIPREAMARATAEIIPELFAMLVRGSLRIDTFTRPLAEITQAWTESLPSGVRAVVQP